jgi:hypothetical protein
MTTIAEGLTRCHESIRDTYGYSRCHRIAGHAGQLHHVRGRAWSGSWGAGTARLTFGVSCDDGCLWPEQVALWGAPVEGTRPGTTPRHRGPRPRTTTRKG